MPSPVDFAPYLESLAESYRRQQEFYTLTDLQVEIRIPKADQPGAEEEQKEQQEEKVERSPVLAGLRKYVQQGHVLLVGKPGSGKSTTLQRLLWEEAERCLTAISENQATIPPIPVLLELRGLKGSVLKTIQEILEWWVDDLDEKQIKAGLREKKFLVLLDGINELPTLTAWEEISAFRQLCAKAKVPLIFSTRVLEVGAGLGIEHKLEMCPLTEPQMHEFIQKRLPGKADTLLGQLEGRLQELAETPLLLDILCRVFESDGQIPQSRGELFRQQFAQQYEEFKRLPEVVSNSSGLLPRLLQTLAFEMIQGDDPTKPTQFVLQLPKAKAADKLQEFLQTDREKATQYLQVLLKHHLLQQATDPNQIEFCHQLFQEYYAAESLLLRVPHLSDAQLKCDYLNLLKWTEPLAMMLALISDEAQAVRIVGLALEVDRMLGARLAGEVQTDFQKQAIEMVSKLVVPEWLKVKLRRETQLYAAKTVLYKSSEDEVYMGSPPGPIIPFSKSPKYKNLRFFMYKNEANEAIKETNPDQKIPDLVKALTDEDFIVRWQTTKVVLEGDRASIIPGLLEALKDKSSFVRATAAEALGWIGSEDTVSSLLEALEDDCSDVRGEATEALGRIGCEEVMQDFFKVLKDDYSDVRHNVTKVLGRIGGEQGIQKILKLLNDEDDFVRTKAVEVLGRIGSEQAVLGLLESLKDKEDFVRAKAAEALGRIGSEQAASELFEALKDKDEFVRLKATEALEKIGSEQVTPGLLKALKDEDYFVYLTAAKALVDLGSVETIPVWIKALRHKSLHVFQEGFHISQTAIKMLQRFPGW